MKTSTKAAVNARAGELGVAVSEDADIQRIFADAPEGMVFSSTFTHVVVADYDAELGEPKAGAWGSIVGDMDLGLEPCSGCDTCND